MKMKLRGLLILGLVLGLLGCASGPKFVIPVQPRDDMATVYFFRPNSPPLAFKPTILVNGVKVADLTNQGYFDLLLKPGSYTVKADWGLLSGVHDRQFSFQAEAGQIYYMLVASEMNMAGVIVTPNSAVPAIYFESGIGLVSRDVAEGSITKCGLVEKYQGADDSIIPK